MPSRVKFQTETEYMSTFNKQNKDISKATKSPILKPRLRTDADLKQMNLKQSSEEAGLRSLDTRKSQEPPLQHKHTVDYQGNHNTWKTDTTAWRANSSVVKNGGTSKNPILAYDEAVQITRDVHTEKENHGKKTHKDLPGFYKKYAGKDSENIRYLALEPPMQRKRRSPSKNQQHGLETNTINYINDHEREPGNGVKESRKTSSDDKATNIVKRKLDFKNNSGVTEARENRASSTMRPVLNQTEERNNNNNVNVHPSPEPRQMPKNQMPKKALSPGKLQRMKDLDDLKTKQNERVDRALQIKAGLQSIEPPLYSHPLKSEYQRQFAWNEPVLVQQPIVPSNEVASIKVDQNVNAHKQRKARKFKTEYQENFRKFQFTTDLSSNQQFVERKGGKDTTQTNNGPEECMKENLDKRLLQESQNSQPMVLPRSRCSDLTEYNTNFQAPKKFKVKNGAWQSATPPHLHPRLIPESKLDHSDWFGEVLQLRHKAEQYKERSRETHYPTTFLASLDDEEDEAVAHSSRSSSVSSDRENRVVATNPTANGRRKTEEVSASDISAQTDQRVNKYVATNYGDNPVPTQETCADTANSESGASTDSVAVEAETPASESGSTSSSSMNFFKGRVETARLAASQEHRRHNLDRTTPLRAGTAAEPAKRFSSEIAAPLHNFRDLMRDSRSSKVTRARASPKKPFAQSGLNVIEESKQQALATKQGLYIHNKYEDKENEKELDLSNLRLAPTPAADSSQHNQVSRSVKPPKSFVQPIDLGGAYPVDNFNLNSSDAGLSDASMSARDSVISDVLERSRLRRDNFW